MSLHVCSSRFSLLYDTAPHLVDNPYPVQTTQPRLSIHRVSSKVSTSSTLDQWTSAPPAATWSIGAPGHSRPRPGNAGFYPLSALNGRTGALARDVCMLQSRLPASTRASITVSRLWRRELDLASSPRRRLDCIQAASRVRVKAALPPCAKAWVGGISSVSAAGHGEGQVSRLVFFLSFFRTTANC